MVVKECINCFATPDAAPASPALTGLPGLVNLRQVYDYTPGAAQLGSLIVQNTGFADMTSFAGLSCPPGFIYFNKNRQLGTLSGLGALAFPTSSPGVTLVATANALSGPASVQPLRVLAGCSVGGTNSLTLNTYIETASCTMKVRILFEPAHSRAPAMQRPSVSSVAAVVGGDARVQHVNQLRSTSSLGPPWCAHVLNL